MIIAIDESGSFAPDAKERHFFSAIHLRQRRTFYKLKERQFTDWEMSLPRTLKNAKGEIKSSSLSDDQLSEFARVVLCGQHYVGVTPFAINPTDNPKSVVEKHRAVALVGIQEGVKGYTAQGKKKLAAVYQDFGNWLQRLSYSQFLKIVLLGSCLSSAIVNTMGHAISGGHDEELMRMEFLIDRDFIKEPRHQFFWRNIWRNQLYHASKLNPFPMLEKWKEKGHPFLTKYMREGHLDFSDLFSNHLRFVQSHAYFEIRIADAVNTILFRFFNQRRCALAYKYLRSCILYDGKVHQILLRDFDLDAWRYDPDANPWGKFPSSSEKVM
jgi:hypothetical protein